MKAFIVSEHQHEEQIISHLSIIRQDKKQYILPGKELLCIISLKWPKHSITKNISEMFKLVSLASIGQALSKTKPDTHKKI